MSKYDSAAIENFREYLRIPSVNPDPNYDGCVAFLQKQAQQLNLPVRIYHVVPNKPIVVITWQGKDPSLPAILLNSHMDVVPVFEDKWTHKPFAAEMDDKGNIYGRGAQDMKCVGIQYLEAIRKLQSNHVSLKRTVHLSFVPDEEVGGKDGMKAFVKTKDFHNLNVGFSLDEGMANPTDAFTLNYGERCIWHINFHISGQTGHGSLLLDNTVGEKLLYLLSKFYEFRNEQKRKLKSDPKLTIGDVTTVNLTIVQGGVQDNVVPSDLLLSVDCRLTVTTDLEKWEQTLKQWCKEAGGGIEITYSQKEQIVPVTKLDNTNPYWVAFKEATDRLSLKLHPQIFAGGTDSRFIRDIGIPAIGFSPMNNTPILLHDHDEFLNADVFLRGIDIYCEIISSVANF